MEQAGDKTESSMTRLYYRFKPFVPKVLRWALRRHRANLIRESSRQTWPVDLEAGVAPAGWPGWPEGKRFALVLTHDIEGVEGLSKVKQLAGIEQQFGLHSSFNFIPEGEYPVPDDLRYWLAEQGFEVGVHDLNHDGRLYDSRRNFSDKAKRINDYLRKWGATGFRSGFMLRRLRWLHELEVGYDSSTFDTDPFEPQPYGCKTIFPFYIRNSDATGRPGYVELPYTLPQDSTLFLLLGEKSPEIWIKKLDWIAGQGGMALVNIHPDYIDFGGGTKASSYHYPAEWIEEFLGHVCSRYEGQFWNPLARDLTKWFHHEDLANCEGMGRSKGKCTPGVTL